MSEWVNSYVMYLSSRILFNNVKEWSTYRYMLHEGEALEALC